MLDGLINPIHIMIIMAVVIVLFGPKRLPEMGQKLGQALRDFKSATSDIRSQIGIDDIAGSVSDIKSSLSLTATERPQPAGEVAPVSPVSAVTGEPPQAATVSADKVAESPARDPLSGAPADGQPVRSDGAVAAVAGDEVGVEAFGALKQGSRSLRGKSTAG